MTDSDLTTVDAEPRACARGFFVQPGRNPSVAIMPAR